MYTYIDVYIYRCLYIYRYMYIPYIQPYSHTCMLKYTYIYIDTDILHTYMVRNAPQQLQPEPTHKKRGRLEAAERAFRYTRAKWDRRYES
jgi:hypothetical protein